LNKIIADHPGLGYRTGINITGHIKNLHDWGWLN
jgi:hypothetical protein